MTVLLSFDVYSLLKFRQTEGEFVESELDRYTDLHP